MKRGALISPDMFVLHPALLNFGLPFYPVFAPFFPSVLFWQVFGKNCLSSPNYARLVFFLSPPLLLYFYYHGGFHERTSAIWRWKGWNHPDSCPVTEPLKLPDKAVRLHFGSNCQSKLALPFTINKRRRAVPFQSVSEPSNCSPFWEALNCIFSPLLSLSSLYICLLIFLALFSSFLSISVVYHAVFTLVETLLSVVRDVYIRHKTYAWKNTQVAVLYTHTIFDLCTVCFIIFSSSLLMFNKSPAVYFSACCLPTDVKYLVIIMKTLLWYPQWCLTGCCYRGRFFID